MIVTLFEDTVYSSPAAVVAAEATIAVSIIPVCTSGAAHVPTSVKASKQELIKEINKLA